MLYGSSKKLVWLDLFISGKAYTFEGLLLSIDYELIKFILPVKL